uniref:Uncharacterized protein n=1 Tax=Arundo donax TaxID=35708 RepID=A0A0A9HCE0_ARUDO
MCRLALVWHGFRRLRLISEYC